VNDCNPDVKSPDWMVRLFTDEKFKNEVNCRYFEARANQMSNKAVFAMMDSLYNVVKNAQVKHFQKWQILGKNVGAPEVDAQPATYTGEVEKLKNWITLRLNWLDKNMPGKCSTVNTHQLAENKGIRIYPNPATDELNILSGETISSVQIFDLAGKTILVNHAVNAEMIRIDISAFNPGMVIVKMIDMKGNSVSKKIVVK
jgi:hypothetical protein